MINNCPLSNLARVFTSISVITRKFQYEIDANNLGVIIGIVAPTTFSPFRSIMDAFFKSLQGQGRDIEHSMSLSAPLRNTIKIRETGRKFCEGATSCAKRMIADVLKAFEWVIRRKNWRNFNIKEL